MLSDLLTVIDCREWSHPNLNVKNWTNPQYYGYYVHNKLLREFVQDPKRPFQNLLETEVIPDDFCKASKNEGGEIETTIKTIGTAVPILRNPCECDRPLPRYQASICVNEGHMYLFGGSLELEKRTIVFDDMWMLNLKTFTWVVVSNVKEMFCIFTHIHFR